MLFDGIWMMVVLELQNGLTRLVDATENTPQVMDDGDDGLLCGRSRIDFGHAASLPVIAGVLIGVSAPSDEWSGGVEIADRRVVRPGPRRQP